MKTPKEFFAYAKKHKAEMVDLKFTDLLGTWQHCSFPVDTWDEGTFKTGVGFDGSSIRGWQGIHVSDMLAVPDASTAKIDPFFAQPTVSVIADVRDPITGEEYSRDPRHVARTEAERRRKPEPFGRDRRPALQHQPRGKRQVEEYVREHHAVEAVDRNRL